MKHFHEQVYALVRAVPPGRVTTYGAIGRAMGNPRLAHAVGNAMARCGDGFATPCWRVLNARGRLAASFGLGGPELQRRLLEDEGVEVSPDGFVDLRTYGYFFDE